MQNISLQGGKTMPKIRKEIHASNESLMVLIQRCNLNFKTILKWIYRGDFSDKPSDTIKSKSILADQEQAVICEFRRITDASDSWTANYNADKCPTSFSQAQSGQNTIIECDYDYIGRRYTKKVTSNGTVSLHQRYIYRGYLQIACVDLTRSEHPTLWYITWDPTEPVATRPLAIQKNATWYTYSHDLTKNVTELYKTDGLIATTYDYSPCGAVTAEGTDQPIQYSSEYHDSELSLTYYNYRHYNPTDGRWINRDPLGENAGFNLYDFLNNDPIFWTDYLGLAKSRLAKRFKPSPCCKCGNATVQDNQYYENGKVKERTKEKITIYFGHCNGKLPDNVQDDDKSLKIGMVTCFADKTLTETVTEEGRRLQNTRPHGHELLYPDDATDALKEEIAAATIAVDEICKEKGKTILQIQIQITAADNAGRDGLNKVYKSTGRFKLESTTECPVPSCADRGGILHNAE